MLHTTPNFIMSGLWVFCLFLLLYKIVLKLFKHKKVLINIQYFKIYFATYIRNQVDLI